MAAKTLTLTLTAVAWGHLKIWLDNQKATYRVYDKDDAKNPFDQPGHVMVHMHDVRALMFRDSQLLQLDMGTSYSGPPSTAFTLNSHNYATYSQTGMERYDEQGMERAAVLWA